MPLAYLFGILLTMGSAIAALEFFGLIGGAIIWVIGYALVFALSKALLWYIWERE